MALALAAPAAAQAPNIVQVATGQVHSYALGASGQVWCWGKNSFGQLGDGTEENRQSPVRVRDLGGGAVQVATGQSHSCAVRDNGRVFCWGSNLDGQLGNRTLAASSRPLPVRFPRAQ